MDVSIIVSGTEHVVELPTDSDGGVPRAADVRAAAEAQVPAMCGLSYDLVCCETGDTLGARDGDAGGWRSVLRQGSRFRVAPSAAACAREALRAARYKLSGRAFLRAASERDTDALRHFLTPGVLPPEEWTAAVGDDAAWIAPMHAAAQQGWLDVLRVFIERGAEAEAAAEEEYALVQPLIAACSTQAPLQWTPLHYAARCVQPEAATLLLASPCCDVCAPDEEGRTPLHEAAFAGSTDMIKLLLQHGADPHATSNYYIETAADFAKKRSHAKAHAELCRAMGQTTEPCDETSQLLKEPAAAGQPHTGCMPAWLATAFSILFCRGEVAA